MHVPTSFSKGGGIDNLGSCFFKGPQGQVLIKADKMIHQVYSASKAENSAFSQEGNTFNDSRDKVVIWKSTNTA